MVCPSGQKYPVRRELRFANKLACPGWVVNRKTARLSNRILDQMALKLPAPPQGIASQDTQCFSADGSPVRLTVYRPKDMAWAAPCLCGGGGI